MRALFLLLLLANAALFGWNWYQSRVLTGARSQAPSTADEGRGLRLLSELPAGRLQPIRDGRTEGRSDTSGKTAERPPSAVTEQPAPDATASPGPETVRPPEAPPRCYRAGQIESRAVRDRLLQALEQRGLEARSGTEEGHGESHWVLLPPFPDEDAARNVMARLREKGVRDLYLVPSGENRNAISLGVFKERPRADQRLARIRRLGFDARMRSLPLPSTRYWVRFRWPGERGEPPIPTLTEDTGVDLGEVTCP